MVHYRIAQRCPVCGRPYLYSKCLEKHMKREHDASIKEYQLPEELFAGNKQAVVV